MAGMDKGDIVRDDRGIKSDSPEHERTQALDLIPTRFTRPQEGLMRYAMSKAVTERKKRLNNTGSRYIDLETTRPGRE